MKLIKKITDNIIRYKILIILLVIYMIFHVFLENIITTTLVNPLLSTVQSTLINDIIFLILLLTIIFHFIIAKKKNQSISPEMLIISAFLCPLIIYYRFFSNTWSFTPFSLINPIKYLDVSIILFLSLIFLIAHRSKEYEHKKDSGFCLDKPIREINKDLLFQNKNIIETLTNKIINTADNKEAFTIGIYSDWGYGKTSFLNLIQEKLGKDSNRIILNFNPWLNNDEKAIIYSFFNELSRALNCNKKLSKEIIQYANLLNAIHPNALSTLSNNIFSLVHPHNSTLESQFNSINDSIKKQGKQIIIFIDDMDRLYGNEILEVLKLIRNSANFANIVFVVAYDRNYLISALRKTNEYHPEDYLRKIFQLEISLPQFDPVIIANKLKDLIEFHISEPNDREKLINIVEEAIQNKPKFYLAKNYFHLNLLTDLRDIHRFFNSFNLLFSTTLKYETDWIDLLNIELLRLRYPGVYHLLAKNYNTFLQPYAYEPDWVSFLSLKKNKDEKDKDETELEAYLEHHLLETGINESQIKDVISCIYSVFPHYKNHGPKEENLLSITHHFSVDRYFHYALLDSDLPYSEFKKTRAASKEEFQKKILEWIKQGLYVKLNKQLQNITRFDNRKDYELIIESIFYFASLPTSENKNAQVIGFDYENLSHKLDYKIASIFYSKDEFKNYILQLFKNQPKPYKYISDLINTILESNNNIPEWKFILTTEELLQLKLEYFKNYIRGKKKLDKYVIYLFKYLYFFNKWKPDSKHIHTMVENNQDEAKSIFIQFAQKIPENFFRNIIGKKTDLFDEEDKHLYNILNIVEKVWDSWANFEEFMNSFDNKNQIKGLNEFQRFYAAFKQNSFRYIPFEFKEIDLSKALLLGT